MTIPNDRSAESDRLGAVPVADGGFHFRVWAPRARRVNVVYDGTRARRFALERVDNGYFVGRDPRATAGDLYRFEVDRRRLPDPASRSQPRGFRGPSALVDLMAFEGRVPAISDPRLANSVLYELHLGTFSPQGTFDEARVHLESLARLGVTAVELLPVEEERGDRGWGYGPVLQFAVRRSYGGPGGLLRFVAAAHRVGLSVLLDVVYNHWSGEARFLEHFGPYFHPRASTPWGPTPNVDGPGSDEVRRYFFENARMWLVEYGVDGFRLDAVHEIFDRSARPFWGEFSEYCRAVTAPLHRRPLLIAESDLNDVRILRPVSEGGWGLDAQWSDDFHSALHAALTGERAGYYVDFGPLDLVARAFEHPFLLEGTYSRYKDRRYGAPAVGVRPEQFVVFDQNHDQVGNRGDGARLTVLLPHGLARVALGLTLFSPYVPMLFMGEEYGETRPFYFFANPPPVAGLRVKTDRLRQLEAHGFPKPPPDPSLRSTFERSQLDWNASETPGGLATRALVSDLLRLRRELPALRPGGSTQARAWEEERLLLVRRDADTAAAALLANIGPVPRRFPDLGAPGLWIERLRSDRPFPVSSARGEPPMWTLDGRENSPPVQSFSFVILERSSKPGAT